MHINMKMKRNNTGERKTNQYRDRKRNTERNRKMNRNRNGKSNRKRDTMTKMMLERKRSSNMKRNMT